MGENREIVAVVGVGYIGLPLTAALANVGYNVIGIDINKEKVDNLNKTYKADIYEPGLNETLDKNKEHIEFTTDYAYAMDKAKAIFITVGTPLKNNEEPNYEYIDSAIDSIGKNLKKGQIVILKSTIIIGTTEEHAKKRLENISNLRGGEDFYLVFCPERTIEGKALEELYTLPKIIGGINKESTDKAAAIIEKLGSKVYKVSSPKIAEMCKLIDNLFRSVNIALANEVGEICEKIGINANEVVAAVNDSYDRTQLFQPGLGADGPCLSKDPMIFRHSANIVGLDTSLTTSTIEKNKESTLRIASIVLDFIKRKNIQKPIISFIGLAFKGNPETDDIRGSPAIKIYNALKDKLNNAHYKFYDPIIKQFIGKETDKSIEESIKDSDVILFLTNHKKIMNIDSNHIISDKERLIIDCWGNIKNIESLKNKVNIEVFRVGRGKI